MCKGACKDCDNCRHETSGLITSEIKENAIDVLECMKNMLKEPDTDDLVIIKKRIALFCIKLLTVLT